MGECRTSRSRRYGRCFTGVTCAVLVACSFFVAPRTSGARAASHGVVTITESGSIGAVRLNVSTAADIEQQWGPAAYSTTGNVMGISNSYYPNYRLFGYECHQQRGYTVCAINFYMSRRTHRLESFTTTSPRFRLFGGVHVGMAANVASSREHKPDIAGCGQFISVSTPQLFVAIWTRGGRAHLRDGTEYVSGGRVASIGIDYKRHGVGVLFC